SPGADVCVSCGARLASAVSLSASDDKLMAVLAHILTIVAGFIPPLIIWLIKGKESSYVEEHSKESPNFQISLIIYWFGTFILSFVLIGFVIMPVLAIFALVVIILATIKANNGEIYRYPLCIRLIK
ncbi:MAG TPA: DUF4870 domain-containing protein, partial [Armatimonadota bacterium]|nr:DUF4870 domain-containing protein [Armatimonadota bacterium]